MDLKEIVTQLREAKNDEVAASRLRRSATDRISRLAAEVIELAQQGCDAITIDKSASRGTQYYFAHEDAIFRAWRWDGKNMIEQVGEDDLPF